MLKIRLRRMGARNRPYYRVVVSDSRKVPTADAVEEIGSYDPTAAPEEARIDVARAEHWIARGARVSPAVDKLLSRQLSEPAAEEAPEAAPEAAPEPESASA